MKVGISRRTLRLQPRKNADAPPSSAIKRTAASIPGAGPSGGASARPSRAVRATRAVQTSCAALCIRVCTMSAGAETVAALSPATTAASTCSPGPSLTPRARPTRLAPSYPAIWPAVRSAPRTTIGLEPSQKPASEDGTTSAGGAPPEPLSCAAACARTFSKMSGAATK
eukprot:scaffold8708_cov30-Tisochrysis_lutea.AAC.2